MVLMQIASIVIYMISIILLYEYFDLQYLDIQFIWKVCFIVLVAWIPFQIMTALMNFFDPSESVKIMNALKVEN